VSADLVKEWVVLRNADVLNVDIPFLTTEALLAETQNVRNAERRWSELDSQSMEQKQNNENNSRNQKDIFSHFK